MKKAFSIIGLSLLLSVSAFPAVVSPGPGLVPSVTMGGVTLPLSKAIILHASNGTSSFYDTLRLNGSAYQVTSGKTLYLVAVRCMAVNATAVAINSFGYGDSAVSNSASAPTNFVNKLFNGLGQTIVYAPASIGSTSESPTFYSIPSGKYPVMQGTNAPICTFVGYEQ